MRSGADSFINEPCPTHIVGNIYLYANGNPVRYNDPWGLLSSAAQAYVSKACAKGNGSPDAAQSDLMEQRVAINWDATTPDHEALREAENYMAAYQNVYGGNVPVANWAVYAFALTPGWQALRGGQNLLGYEMQSPASFAALAAGYQGGNDAYRDRFLGRSPCGCGQ